MKQLRIWLISVEFLTIALMALFWFQGSDFETVGGQILAYGDKLGVTPGVLIPATLAGAYIFLKEALFPGEREADLLVKWPDFPEYRARLISAVIWVLIGEAMITSALAAGPLIRKSTLAILVIGASIIIITSTVTTVIAHVTARSLLLGASK